MKITLIDAGSFYRPAIVAWQNSRNPDEPPGENIYGIDAPVNEMPSVVLHFQEFMILEREIIFSARNHVAWARTSRVDDVLQFKVPEEFQRGVHEFYREAMQKAKADGVAQDQFRMSVPLVAETSWTARMSFRDLVKMHKYFFYLAGVVVDELRPRFAKVARAFYDVAINMVTLATLNDAIEKFRLDKYLCEAQPWEISHDNAVRNGKFTSLYTIVPIALRAQLVRHRTLLFNDTLFRSVLCGPDFVNRTLASKVAISCTATEETWRQIVGKRTCWIAQADIWEPITIVMGEMALPCSDGTCPYEIDARNRLDPDKDPNPPCPRFMNLYHIDKDANTRYRMESEAGKRGPSAKFWMEEIIK